MQPVPARMKNSAKLPVGVKRTLTNYENELIAALEAQIRKWDALVLHFEQNEPGVEIHGLPKITGREFANNLREKSAQYRELIDRIKSG